jgi:hypothetical protein
LFSRLMLVASAGHENGQSAWTARRHGALGGADAIYRQTGRFWSAKSQAFTQHPDGEVPMRRLDDAAGQFIAH